MPAHESSPSPYAVPESLIRARESTHRVRLSFRLMFLFSFGVVVAGYVYCIISSGKIPGLLDVIREIMEWPVLWLGSLAAMTATYTLLRPLTVGRRFSPSPVMIIMAAFVALNVLPEIYVHCVVPAWIEIVNAAHGSWNTVARWVPLAATIPMSIGIALCAEYLFGRALVAFGFRFGTIDQSLANTWAFTFARTEGEEGTAKD